MHLSKHKSCSRAYDSCAEGSLLFGVWIVLQLFSSCRSLVSFSQDARLHKALSSGLGSPPYIGSVSSQCLAEQPGLISSPTWHNNQYLSNTTLAFHLSTLFCLLLRVFYQSLSQSSEDCFSPSTVATLLWFLPGFCDCRSPWASSSERHCPLTHFPSLATALCSTGFPPEAATSSSTSSSSQCMGRLLSLLLKRVSHGLHYALITHQSVCKHHVKDAFILFHRW